MKKILLLLTLTTLQTTYAQTPTSEQLHKQAEQYKQQEKFESAIACYENILQRNKNDIHAWFHLGVNAISIGAFEYAIEAFDKVLSLKPDVRAAWYNNGYTLKQMGKLNEAIKILEALLEVHPDHGPAYVCLAYAYMMNGDMLNGYKYHLWHLNKAGKYAPEFRTLYNQMNLQGKTILLIPEGGLGDTLQFIRYAQRLQEHGAYVIAAVQPALVALLKNSPFIDRVISTESNFPENDATITLMSLPAALHDTLETIPCTIPYIFPEKKLTNYWSKELAKDTNFKVGICWQASIANDKSRMPVARRGCPLELFAQLFDIPNTSWYSLQKHDGLEELQDIDATKLHLFDKYFDETHGAFMDTAAVIQSLDLIITIDSAIAHLAGALGKPVWLLLPLVTDWRWIVDRTDSPWYPTMRIFKQTEPFGWQVVINKVKKELEKIT